jgi:hypothetical protein
MNMKHYRHFRLLAAGLMLTLAAPAAHAQQWTVLGESYTPDTLFHTTVAPGITQTTLDLKGGTMKLRVCYATADLGRVRPRVVKGCDSIAGHETLSGMAQRKGRRYIAGVNADFFYETAPCGATVVDGEFYWAGGEGWQGLAIDSNGKPHIVQNAVFNSVIEGQAISVNTEQAYDGLTLYTPRYGHSTRTDATAAEVVLKPVGRQRTVTPGQDMTFKVTSTAGPSSHNLRIPRHGFVLSGSGNAAERIKGLRPGQQLHFRLDAWADGRQMNDIVQFVGGCPRILSGGQALDTEGVLDHLAGKHPRTAVGYDSTGTKLVILVVEGRSAHSHGIRSRGLADIMRSLGCTEALNFDGGGSSELYVRRLGPRNFTTDGHERRVINALFLSKGK